MMIFIKSIDETPDNWKKKKKDNFIPTFYKTQIEFYELEIIVSDQLNMCPVGAGPILECINRKTEKEKKNKMDLLIQKASST